MVLKLSVSHINAIRAHAERTYPDECCGLLLGQIGDTDKTVVEIWETQNAWSQEAAEQLSDRAQLTKERRYFIDPVEMLRAQKSGRDRNLITIGIYHSHPDCAPIPSECDRQYAWPEYSYIIVSVIQGKAADLGNWILDETHQFQLEDVLTNSSED